MHKTIESNRLTITNSLTMKRKSIKGKCSSSNTRLHSDIFTVETEGREGQQVYLDEKTVCISASEPPTLYLSQNCKPNRAVHTHFRVI